MDKIDCSSDVSGNALLTTLRNTAGIRSIEIHMYSVIRSPESDGKAKQRIFGADVDRCHDIKNVVEPFSLQRETIAYIIKFCINPIFNRETLQMLRYYFHCPLT